ncbi:hypothetical protein H5410_013710 [Solanum commersonii]|uniref:Uncharacterized protein n=1 Tax=Solanum commersonii TaxID=4109 RepID=A0A9J5ZNZ6_SOLCO|nr:hypothetical protein H5410_013710 [Solanum commersonii]
MSRNLIVVALATCTNSNCARNGKKLILAKTNDLALSKNNYEKLLNEGIRAVLTNKDIFCKQINAGNRGITSDGYEHDLVVQVQSKVGYGSGENVGEEHTRLTDASAINQALVATPFLIRNNKALVLEYMPNGSLDKWLYSHNYFFDIMQRLSIMKDTGEIPKAIGSLENLRVLILGGNKFIGIIPREIGNLVNLVELGVEVNQISSSIPISIFNILVAICFTMEEQSQGILTRGDWKLNQDAIFISSRK